MSTAIQPFHPLVFLAVATALEVSGDAVLRIAIYEQQGIARLGLLLVGGGLLLGYGACLNLAPLHFGEVVGLYIATLFVMWQIVNFVAFRSLPTLPVLVGGAMIVLGGLVVSFWRPA